MGGGSSSSRANTSNTDKRLVVDSGTGVSADKSTVNLTVTDNGAVSRALDSVDAANYYLTNAEIAQVKAMNDTVDTVVNSNADSLGKSLDFAKSVFNGGLQVLDSGKQILTDSGQQVAKAYDAAKGAGDEKMFAMIAAAAVIAIVGVKSLGKS